jgi:molybdate transport system substrate-binding protein
VRALVKLSVLAAVVVGLVATGCSSNSRSDGSGERGSASKVGGTIRISDAASLTEAFEKIGADFTAANPRATVTFNPGSSGTLAIQILQTNGVGIDTFASADAHTMSEVESAGLIDGRPVVFARNKLVIVTKPGNPEHVTALADLTDLNVVSLCGLTAPCGRYAAQILHTAGVTIPETRITRGVDVKGTLAAVTSGDADAAIVYVSDAEAAGDRVDAVAIPDADNAIATYPIATLSASANKVTARAFVDYVMSGPGQATLRSFGFLPPS